MISFLRGTLVQVGTTSVVLDVNGVGYELIMPVKALAALPSAGAEVQLCTYMHVKEDGITLFGFSSAEERAMFERLIGVSGIGPKSAVSALSTFSASELFAAITDADVTALCMISGIGKKAASRIVLELQGVLKTEQESGGAVSAADSSEVSDAKEALIAMGFSSAEVSKAFKGIDTKGKSSSELIRCGLKNVGGK